MERAIASTTGIEYHVYIIYCINGLAMRLHLIFLLLLIIATGVGAQESEPIKILAWVADGIAPGEQTTPGDIVFIDENGPGESLLAVPADTRRIQTCGEQAGYATFFIGNDSGTLYMVDPDDNLYEVQNSVNAMACLGMGSLQFAGERFGYIDFLNDTLNSTYAMGWLYVRETSTRNELFNFENVVDFDLHDESLALISFYTDDQGAANEAAVLAWAGGGPNEVSTLFTDEGCAFRSAQIVQVSAEQLVFTIGQRCTGGTEWALYTVDLTTRSTNRALVINDVPGAYLPAARTNTLVASPDGSAAFATYPDGLGQNTAFVQPIQLDNIQAEPAVFNNTIMPVYINTTIYPRTLNTQPLMSPDGAWLAMVSNSPNDEAALNLIELNAPDLPPITINARNRGDTISSLQFLPDSSGLVFVIGGNNGDNNSLFAVDLASASESRLTRGRYGRAMVMAPDGQRVTMTNWQMVDQTNQENYLNLVTVDLVTRETIILFTGAEIVDDQPGEQRRFAYPLSWR
jgi:hypothetical protein